MLTLTKILRLFRKYNELILYGIFGVLATVINILAYWLAAHPLGISTMPSTVIAWTVAVFFAYFTNSRYVFRSGASARGDVLREMAEFFICRIATGVVDMVLMYVFVEVMRLDDVLVKTLSNIVVIILNYLCSKLWIFKSSGALPPNPR